MRKAKSLSYVRTKGGAIGADHVIDYTKEDFARNGQQYDLILATNGDRSISDYRHALTAKGVYVQTGKSMAQISFSAGITRGVKTIQEL